MLDEYSQTIGETSYNTYHRSAEYTGLNCYNIPVQRLQE